jgi:hypothetical protein
MGFSSAERSIALYDRMAPRPLPTFTRMSCAVDGCKKRGIHKVPVRKQTDIYFCADHREEGISRENSVEPKALRIAMKRSLLSILVLFCSLSAWCQYANVSATLTDGSGSFDSGGYLHFSLRNCGVNFPVVKGAPFTPAKASFDLKPNQATGVVTGQVVGNDLILCGNVASTYYEVTMMKDATDAFAPALPFIIASGSNWTPASQPMSNPPTPPGFVNIFANPTANRTLVQPANTTLYFQTQAGATIDFTGANVAGLGPSAAAGRCRFEPVTGISLARSPSTRISRLVRAQT